LLRRWFWARAFSRSARSDAPVTRAEATRSLACRLSGLELDAGSEVGMVVDELAPDPGLPGDAGDGGMPAGLALGVGDGEHETPFTLAVRAPGPALRLGVLSCRHRLPAGHARRGGRAWPMAG
jgi:hypothetical protein